MCQVVQRNPRRRRRRRSHLSQSPWPLLVSWFGSEKVQRAKLGSGDQEPLTQGRDRGRFEIKKVRKNENR
jgi:hypothetical protein